MALVSPIDIVVLAAIALPVVDLLGRRAAHRAKAPLPRIRATSTTGLLRLGHTYRRTVVVLYLWPAVAFGAVSFGGSPAAVVFTLVLLLAAFLLTLVPPVRARSGRRVCHGERAIGKRWPLGKMSHREYFHAGPQQCTARPRGA